MLLRLLLVLLVANSHGQGMYNYVCINVTN